MNKTRIRIEAIRDFGRNQDLYCSKIGLRRARRVGDEEVVNNTVLGRLRMAGVQFEKID